MSALIEFDEVCKYYQMGDTTVKAADHITMKIEKGEFVAIVGQSGSGKSTCMNIIGCLDVPTHGTYRLNGRDVGKMNRNELAAVRNEMLGFIFQQYNLLPRLNLMENVEVPLVYAGISRADRHIRAREVLEQVGLGDKLKNRPNQLSGGQQQRVALARALVLEPGVLLFDEPLSNLDAKLRVSMRTEIRRIQQATGITAIYVTHDQSEAMALSDSIIIMNKGVVAQIGSPQEIYYHPNSEFVADFIGEANFLRGKCVALEGGSGVLQLADTQVRVAATENMAVGEDYTIVLRPESAGLVPEGNLKCRVVLSCFMGAYQNYHVMVGDTLVKLTDYNPKNHRIYQVGETCALTFEPDGVHVL